MKQILVLSTILACGVVLSGCSTIFGRTQSPNFEAFLNDIKACDRDYQVAFGGGVPSLNGSARITCKAQLPTPVAQPTQ